MLISPPFLPASAGLFEDPWLDTAMSPPQSLVTSTLAPEGSFPLSRALAWHNGIHIQAPQANGSYLPVRAVADGEVVFVHPPTPPVPDLNHPLNHDPFGSNTPGGDWSSDGFIVIRHTTDIGATGTRPTDITFYSACMHLDSIAACPKSKAAWKPGDLIYRKDEIGTAGKIYGHDGQIHFEICCDEANLKKITGRDPLWAHPLSPAPPSADGRSDSVFGSICVYLPATTPVSAAKPTQHARAAASQTLGTAQWVRITYDKGSALTASLDLLGKPIGLPLTERDYEYRLYAEANDRSKGLQAALHASAPNAAPTGSPSDWYELLRFGRVLSASPLGHLAAHWRCIPTAGGTVWADLNAAGTFKFSDADFPSVMGWNFFSDDTSPTDQRCDSVNLKMLIRDPDPSNPQRMDVQQLARRLGRAEVRSSLRRAICKFPCEWDRDTVESRYSWLVPDKTKVIPCDWSRQLAHMHALTSKGLPREFLDATWRFHPREFVGWMRQCGWLASRELSQCLPRHAIEETKDGTNKFIYPKSQISWASASARSSTYAIALNHALRKYGISSTFVRMAFFLANSIQETIYFTSKAELGGASMPYAP